MTIEVRQLTIRSTVEDTEHSWREQAPGEVGGRLVDEEWAREFRRELLDECKRWVDKRLTTQTER